MRFRVNATTVASTPRLTASGIKQTTATLTISGHTGAWYYKRTTPSGGSCTLRSATQPTATLPSLSAGTAYTYKAYSDSNCSDANELASVSFTTLDLKATSITQTGATLTLSGTGAPSTWYYKRTGINCTSSSTAAVNVTSLSAGTSYTYEAFSDSTCTNANRLATLTFSTTAAAGPTPPSWSGDSDNSTVTYGGRTLRPSGGATSQVLSAPLRSAGLLRGDHNSLSSANRLSCGNGTTLEFGWYKSTALTTRVGTGTVVSPPGIARIYRGEYTPPGLGEYRFLAYCTTGTGGSKVYSTAVNLLGPNGKMTITEPVSLSTVTYAITGRYPPGGIAPWREHYPFVGGARLPACGRVSPASAAPARRWNTAGTRAQRSRPGSAGTGPLPATTTSCPGSRPRRASTVRWPIARRGPPTARRGT